MLIRITFVAGLIAVVGPWIVAGPLRAAEKNDEERLSFQTFGPWDWHVNLNADVAIVYGIDPSLPARVASWRDHRYRIHVMTGVSWGNYQDYVDGRYDGKKHADEQQTDGAGNPIRHGGSADVCYMSPGDDYGAYLAAGVKRALDAGAQAICLEEPEFWAAGGWEENFKRQWKAYYHDEWRPPDSSPDAQYRASKLKYFLYRRTLSTVFDFVRHYGKEHGRSIPCYVASHSLLNYAHWRIVSPESSLLGVGCNGYIAQVWTGTSRTPNVYEGALRQRTFETAYLEYGAMQNLVRASGRRVWYLNDPVEDDPNHTWDDYRANWESTLTASLLQPEVWRYEIMPWPQRVFEGTYPAATAATRVGIPPEYATELQTVISALADMKQPAASTRWEVCGTQGVGLLVSDTMMFQRGGPGASDEHLGSFYGLALPLLERGIPVEPVQIENASQSGFLDRYKVLLLTYEGQKPPSAEFHSALAGWVKQGGALVVIDDDKDPYNGVHEWWNTRPMTFATPRQHLFQLLGLAADVRGVRRVGKGVVLYEPASPAGLSYRKNGAEQVRQWVRQAAVGLPWKQSAALVLRRGPYVVAAGLDDLGTATKPVVLHGRFMPLFDADLPVVDRLEVAPGRRALLLDLDALPRDQEGVVAAACRVSEQRATPDSLRFWADGIETSRGTVCLRLPWQPRSVLLDGKAVSADSFDFHHGLLHLRFVNSATPRKFEIRR